MGMLDKMFRQKKRSDSNIQSLAGNWTTLQSKEKDRAFTLVHPSSWSVKIRSSSLDIIPDDNPGEFDPGLGQYVASPGINIMVGDVSEKKGSNMARGYMEVRPKGYEGYTLLKRYNHRVHGAKDVVAYQFEYGNPGGRFRALSLLVQADVSLFIITASATCDDFDRYATVLETIVFSFTLT